MKLNIIRPLGLVFPLLGVLLLLAGCGTPKPKPMAWNINITKPGAIEVDLVAVTAREKSRLESYSMDKYWSPGDPERAGADKLTSDTGETWSLTKKDPKWKSWLGRRVDGLFIIANLPGNFAEAADPRREYLPLNKHHWDAKKSTLAVEVQTSRIRILTPEKPTQ